MIEESFFICEPVDFKGKFKVYPPRVKEILNPNFQIFNRLLTYSQEEIEDELLGYDRKQKVEKVPTPFEFLLISAYHSKEIEQKIKQAFNFFCHIDVTFLYDLKKIVIGDLQKLLEVAGSLNDLMFLEEDEFFDFQNLVRASTGEKQIEKPPEDEDIRITRMKAKSRYRDRVKAKNSAKDKNNLTLLTRLASICCMGIGITPLNIGEVSYASISILSQMYQNKEKFELDVRSQLAGSKKAKPKYWITNVDK